MAVLKDTFAHHFEVVAILAGLFVFVVLVTPSPPVQGSLRPPSVCVAPYVYYERIGMIQPYLLFSILVSGLLTSSLKRRTAAADAPPPTLWIRAYGMLALLLSFVSILLLAVLASYMAQVRSSTFSCWSGASKASACIFGTFVGLVCVATYYELATVIMWAAY
ncbi:hypothetical protein CFC21_112502 [Triticum aestivum]|uniref:Uncharacterized protein n=3 Tax=Triticinae TaxID=1648030 RepID=A0A453JDU4_AEGTS|nr:uncharacterized protein LOC109768860 [Aegilops tauschii subsp. strangulata]XP_044378624.1 uncharacterized protein LOC123100816 [Triticum aestivum]MBC2899679.1 hypothetical protein [Triticum aestivum]